MRQLNFLQVLRGIAAVMVVLFHAHIYVLPHKIQEGKQIFLGFNMGYSGVEIFFVLSGFIMWHIHHLDLGQPSQLGRFVFKRITRIYPTYLLVLAGIVSLYFIIPDSGPENARNIPEILLSASLLPTSFLPVLDVAWTLQYEMLFYCFFALLIYKKWLGKTAFLIWGLFCIGNIFINTQIFPLSFFFSAYHLLFLMGMGIATLYQREVLKYPSVYLAAGISIFLLVGISDVYGLIQWYKPLRTICFGVGASLLLASTSLEKYYKINWPKPLIILGDASYSIYLCHVPGLLILSEILERLGMNKLLPPAVIFYGLVTIVIISAIAFYYLIEIHILGYFHRLAKKIWPR